MCAVMDCNLREGEEDVGLFLLEEVVGEEDEALLGLMARLRSRGVVVV